MAAHIGVHHGLQLGVFVVGLLHALAHHDRHAGQQLQVRRVTAERPACGLSGRRNRRAPVSISTAEPNTTSAVSAASALPASEAPAWMITGRPCGVRAMLSAPLTLKCGPACSTGVQLRRVEEHAGLAVANEGVVLPRCPTARWSRRRTPARGRTGRHAGASLAWPKLRAAKSLADVTTFHAARPRLIWSSEANWRAMLYGSLKLVLAVPPSPMNLRRARRSPSAPSSAPARS